MNRLVGLELLRGVAALLVLAEHVPGVVQHVLGVETELPPALGKLHGYWGVDLFFVLSGYLIGLTLDRPATTGRSFLLARCARVLPLYAVASVACLAIPGFRTAPLDGSMLVTTLTLMPVSGDALKPLTAHPCGWTLCYEMGFYLVAATLAATVGCRRAAPVMVGLFALAPLAFTAAGPFAGWDYPSFALAPFTAEFALGLLAYRLTDRLPRRAAWGFLALGVAGCARGIHLNVDPGNLFETLSDPNLGLWHVATWGLPAAALVLGTARLDRDGTFRRLAGVAIPLGAVSYPLYLAQPFAFAAAIASGRSLGFTEPWPTAGGLVVVTLLLAAVVARFVDRPLHDLAKGWARRLSAPRQASSARSFWTFASIRSRTVR